MKHLKQKYLWQFILFVILTILITSCFQSKVITGEIKAINGDSVLCAGNWFKVPKNKPKIGDTCTFTPTVNRRKINSVKLTNKN